ncbi:MAG: RNA-binding S4 domain-containing protein [Salinivirgaceae bacterium]|nr:RNA-binding S4 domain-containing protein [Salinivirgaceae bacterium]
MKQLEFVLKPLTDGSEPFIALNSLLKFMKISENGGMANLFISDGLVTVNGKIDQRKRAKIRKGDVVGFEDVEIHVK